MQVQQNKQFIVLTATHCNPLQLTATHCNTLHHTHTVLPVYLSAAMQADASVAHVHCNSLHTTTHCKMIQHAATCCTKLRHSATLCNTLQHTATRCNSLHHTATHCSTLQHTANHPAHCTNASHCTHSCIPDELPTGGAHVLGKGIHEFGCENLTAPS